MRLVNWNIEWMNNWFVGYGQVAFRTDHLSTGITDVDDLCKRVSGVIKALGPDVLTIEEGPSDIREMELFINTYLSDDAGNRLFDVFGGSDGRSQKIYTLVKKGGEFSNPSIASDSLTLDLDEPWEVDIDGDYQLEGYEFTRLPLVISGTLNTDGSELKIVTLHTKSKYVHNGEAKWNDPEKRLEFVAAALKNRKRISAEAMRVRNYLDDHLEQENESQFIVTGDFNDGPGIDYFERHYITHNVTDILLGSTYYPDLIFHHALMNRVPKKDLYTAIFDDFIDNITNRLLLLDHIIVSPALEPKIHDAKIAHDEYNVAIDNATTGRQKFPSDHRPIYLDI